VKCVHLHRRQIGQQALEQARLEGRRWPRNGREACHCRRHYLPLYVAEFEFRYNNRDNVDIFGTAIAGCRGVVTGIQLS